MLHAGILDQNGKGNIAGAAAGAAGKMGPGPMDWGVGFHQC